MVNALFSNQLLDSHSSSLDSDYTIFVWRQQQQPSSPEIDPSAFSSTSSSASAVTTTATRNPTLHLHNPRQALPMPPEYQSPAYYAFHLSLQVHSSARSNTSKNSNGKKKKKVTKVMEHVDLEPGFKQAFDKFHSENGVRTVMGSIGPVQNGVLEGDLISYPCIHLFAVRMLLKAGYRHVYISRTFALENGFIPADAAPGHYGYSGLVNIGTWPITLTPSTVPSSLPDAPPPVSAPSSPDIGNGSASTITKKYKGSKDKGPKPTMMTVYLSEEPHFDVVLGRSFFERRQIRLTSVDPTDVVCLDTGEKIECELVILKDGRGEIVTVT